VELGEAVSFVNRSNKLREVTDAELVEAVERVDRGFRLALPELAQEIGLGGEGGEKPQREPRPVDHATATEVGSRLLDARKAVMEAGVALPLDGQADLHLALNGLVNEIDRITGELADRWGSE
jgi:hypothetical protein